MRRALHGAQGLTVLGEKKRCCLISTLLVKSDSGNIQQLKVVK